MNFNSLSSNEKLAVYGSLAVIVGMLIGSGGFFGFGLGILALVAAIAMLVIVFLPQLSSGTSLPGSKGTLMFAAGIIAAAVLVITLIQYISFIGAFLGSINGIFFLIAVVGSLVMAWAGWQELQTEGGSFRFGTGATRTPPTRADRDPSGPPRTDAPSSTSANTTGMGSTGPASSAGSTEMGSEGGPDTRRDDDTLRNP
jgi:hypothetical protein